MNLSEKISARVTKLERFAKAAFVLLAVTGIVRSIVYFSGYNVDRYFLQIGPEWAHGVMWLMLGVLSLTATFKPKFRPAAIGLSAGICITWSWTYLGYLMYHGDPNAAISAMNYLSMVAIGVYLAAISNTTKD